LEAHFPANFIDSDASRKVYLLMGFHKDYKKNILLTMAPLLMQYCIWEARLKKKIPSFHSLNQDFIEICRKFVWTNNVAYNCGSFLNFPLRRNLGYGPVRARQPENEREGGHVPQQDHQGHAGQRHQRDAGAQLRRNAPRPPPPQMNPSEDTLRKINQLDPEGLLDRNNLDGSKATPLAKDGEATDPCHVMSSSEEDNAQDEEDGGSYKSGEDDDESGGGEGGSSNGEEEDGEMQVDTSNMNPDSTGSGNPTPHTAAEDGADGGDVVMGDTADENAGGPVGGPTGADNTSTQVTNANANLPGSGESGSRNENSTGENTASPQPGGSRDGGGHMHGGGGHLPGGGHSLGSSGNNFKMPAIPTTQKNNPKKKVPIGVQKIPKEKSSPIPAEADAVPSKTYRAIISSKMLKGKAGTIGGIASGQGNSECGSFF
jgi:hypothetical protein